MIVIVKTGSERVAPSPTGYMHIGAVYAALISHRVAHQTGGVFLLRIEDTDREREVEGATELIVTSLKRYGLTPDEGEQAPGVEVGAYGPYRQSRRMPIYQTWVRELLRAGKAYDDQDPDDLKGPVTVSRHADFRSSQISNVDERAGGGVLLLGIDSVDGRLRVSGEKGDEVFDLGLGVADDAGAHFVIHCLSRAAQRRDKHSKKRQKTCCEDHWSLLSAVEAALGAGRAEAIGGLVACAGVVRRDPGSARKPGAQCVASLGEKVVLAFDQEVKHLPLADEDAVLDPVSRRAGPVGRGQPLRHRFLFEG
jgi:tRNA synthetases class I (E and Q), catalytic domain